jgi:hypothetical protein
VNYGKLSKRYIDLTIIQEMAWSKLSTLELDGVKFAQCVNSHSGFFCLISQTQIKRWD